MKVHPIILFVASILISTVAEAYPKLQQSAWDGKSPLVTGILEKPYAPEQGCSADEWFGDRMVTFDVSKLHAIAGKAFDVNNVYVDGYSNIGSNALNIWLTDWANHHEPDGMPTLNRYTDWSKKISICAGRTVLSKVALPILT